MTHSLNPTSATDLFEALIDPAWIRELRQSHGVTLKTSDTDPDDDQTIVSQWLGRLSKLHGVPFYYLVAEPGMLPPESLRFFYLDPDWLTYLLDGACSVGHTSLTHQAHHNVSVLQTLERARQAGAAIRSTLLGVKPNAPAGGVISGFMLRSNALKYWPAMEIRAHGENPDIPLTPLRMEHLAGTLLLGLFDGDIHTVCFSKPREALHLGFSPDTTDLEVSIRNAQGDILDHTPAQTRGDGRTLIIADCADAMQKKLTAKTFTSAEFALQMIQGVEQVLYTIESK